MQVIRSMRNLTLIALLSALPVRIFSQILGGVRSPWLPCNRRLTSSRSGPQPNYMCNLDTGHGGGPDGYYWVPGNG